MTNEEKEAFKAGKAAYEKRFKESHKIEGFGLGVTVHVPCPFCAAPDSIVHKLIDTEDALKVGATCSECGRGMRGVVAKTESSTTIEFVQTEGSEPPPWIPKMRRETESRR